MQAANPAQDLRKRLLVRLGVAGCALLIGLIALGWFAGSARNVAPGKASEVAPSASVGQPAPASPALAEAGRGVSPGQSAPEDSSAVATPGPGQPKPPTALPELVPGAVPVEGVGATGPALKEPTADAKKQPATPKDKIPRGPHLQAGVFVQAVNAEEFKAKLEAEGLPVYIESRVQIGPFKNRKEAERMREKLKAQGVTTVLITQ